MQNNSLNVKIHFHFHARSNLLPLYLRRCHMFLNRASEYEYGFTLPTLRNSKQGGREGRSARHICHFICHLNVASFLWLTLPLSLAPSAYFFALAYIVFSSLRTKRNSTFVTNSVTYRGSEVDEGPPLLGFDSWSAEFLLK